MSRATVAKSRADKAGKTTSAPTPAVTHEIVPGKCNDQDWNFMLDHDDGDDFVLDMVEEVVESAMSTIYQNYLARQLIPYTVIQAKDALLQIIEWQFLSSDSGEGKIELDVGWQEDEEPEPAMTDCWAQGSVPRRISTPTPKAEELEEVAEEEVPRSPTPISEQAEESDISNEQPADEESSVPTEESVEETPEETQEPRQRRDPRRRNVKFRPYRGKLRSAGVGNMTETLADTEFRNLLEEMKPMPPQTPDTVMLQMPNSCHSIVKNGYEDLYASSSPTTEGYTAMTPPAHYGQLAKLQTGRPPGNRDVVYDDSGNVVAVTKIIPRKLPTHRVRTGFQVVDPEVEAAQARLEAMRTGRRKQAGKTKSKTSPRIVTITAASRDTSGVKAPPGPQPLGRVREGVTPLPPPLVEVMDVAPGVVVKEGDRVREGPKQYPRQAELLANAAGRPLQVVRKRAALPTVLVTELVGRSSPVIKPLGEARPIPPIAPHPPSQAV